MLAAVRHTIQQSLKTCVESSRHDWVAKTPGQAVLCAAQVVWAAGITRAIIEGPKALKQYYQDLQVTKFWLNNFYLLRNVSYLIE